MATLPEPFDLPAVDDVRIVHIDDGDASPVTALLREEWRLLACGVSEQRDVSNGALARSWARCTFILGRSRSAHVLAEAAEVVAATEVQPPALADHLLTPGRATAIDEPSEPVAVTGNDGGSLARVPTGGSLNKRSASGSRVR